MKKTIEDEIKRKLFVKFFVNVIIKSNRFILYTITEETRWLDRYFVNNNSQMANLLLEFVSLFY